MSIEKLSRGLTFEGYFSFIGAIIFIIGLIVVISQMVSDISLIVLAIGLFLIISGLIMFISIKGVLLNNEKKLIKPYRDFILIKLGKWTSLAEYDKIMLKYVNESQRMNSRGNSTIYHTKSFDIVLTSKTKKDLIIKEFIDYDEARSFLIKYARQLDMDYIDIYETIIKRVQERKR